MLVLVFKGFLRELAFLKRMVSNGITV
jgi:hypothetical protein